MNNQNVKKPMANITRRNKPDFKLLALALVEVDKKYRIELATEK